jgi:hypothetical protein
MNFLDRVFIDIYKGIFVFSEMNWGMRKSEGGYVAEWLSF